MMMMMMMMVVVVVVNHTPKRPNRAFGKRDGDKWLLRASAVLKSQGRK